MALGFLDKLSTLSSDDPRAAWQNLQAQQAGTNYLSDPAGTIAATAAIPGQLPQALALRNDQQSQTANKVAVQQAQDAQKLEAQQRITAALQGVHRSGGDIGAAFDSFAPTLAGHGMTAAELAQLKQGIVANPTILDALDTKLQEARNKLVAVPGNGGALYDPAANGGAGGVVARSDYRPVVMRDAAGNSTMVQPTAGGTLGASGGALTNNGGAIKDGKFAQSQPGYAGSDARGFAKFDSPGSGIAAQERLLMGPQYFGGGNNTVAGIVNTYLGKGDAENSPASRANYIKYVAGKLGVDPNAALPNQSVRAVGSAMRGFENVSGTAPASGPGAKVLFQTNASGPGAGGGDLTDAAKQMVADKYKIDGTLPPLGMGKQAAALRTEILNKAAEGNTSGASIVANKADVHALQGSYTNQQKIYGQVSVAEQTALKNGNLFLQIARAAPGQTQFPIANNVIQRYSHNTGNAKQDAMDAAAEVFSQEYGKAISGAAGGSAGLSVSAADHARKLISAQASPQQKMAVMHTLTTDMHNRIDAFRGNIAATRDAIAHIGQGGTPVPKPSAAGTLTPGKGGVLIWSPK